MLIFISSCHSPSFSFPDEVKSGEKRTFLFVHVVVSFFLILFKGLFHVLTGARTFRFIGCLGLFEDVRGSRVKVSILQSLLKRGLMPTDTKHTLNIGRL